MPKRSQDQKPHTLVTVARFYLLALIVAVLLGMVGGPFLPPQYGFVRDIYVSVIAPTVLITGLAALALIGYFRFRRPNA